MNCGQFWLDVDGSPPSMATLFRGNDGTLKLQRHGQIGVVENPVRVYQFSLGVAQGVFVAEQVAQPGELVVSDTTAVLTWKSVWPLSPDPIVFSGNLGAGAQYWDIVWTPGDYLEYSGKK